MKHSRSIALVLIVLGLWVSLSSAQSPQELAGSSVISKSTLAISYQVGRGWTNIDLKSTGLIPRSYGTGKVRAQMAITEIEVDIRGLDQPSTLGSEVLTYVLWAVSPEGRSGNIGEILINNRGRGKLKATTQLQTFSLIVTAEPYFSVSLPSELVVLENEVRHETVGKVFTIEDYKLMRRSQYQKMGNPLSLIPDLRRVPLDMYQARNAVEIARNSRADKDAPENFSKAENSLRLAETALTERAAKKDIATRAREAVQFAEDARALAVQRQEERKITADREAAAAKARAEAEAIAALQATEVKRKAEAEARRLAELAAAREAQLKAEAEAEALRTEAQRMELKAREEAARAEAERAARETERAEQDAERARLEKQQLRAQLLEQFNRILETRDTERGLVVTMADVLFDVGRFELRPEAREILARLSGILLAHQGLMLQVEGHTDSTGSEELNQTLSEQRAGATRDFLVRQGLSGNNIETSGFGKLMPIADNSTASGRQRNRRVEIVISGEVIGVVIGR
jgi:outer membrane protein OmpA-like peptidoglycan-associated protein